MAKYGIYEKALISNALESSLKYASDHGYSFWELSIDNTRKERLLWSDKQIEDLLNVCLRTDMPIYNMVLSLHRDYPLGSNNESIRLESLEFLYKAIDLAVKLGIRTIQLAGYYTSSNDSDDGTLEYFINTLSLGVKYASANGIMLGIENMDYDLITVNDIAYVIKRINSPYLKMFLDVGNLVANQLNPLDQLINVMPHVVGIHLKETKLGVYRRVDFSKGDVPFHEIFELLKELDFDGYFGIEMWNDDNPYSLKKISHALNWLKDQM